MTRRSALVTLGAMLAILACRHEPPRKLRVFTTPPVATTDLAQRLGAEFTKETGVPLEVAVVPEDQIVAAAAKAEAIAIFREPGVGAALAHQQSIRLRSVFAVEDYVIAGPRRDPARIANAPSAAEAFRRIVSQKRSFCSPADVVRTRNAEADIWATARIDPHTNPRYRLCRGTAAEALDRCEVIDAYTLTDRPTAEANHSRRISILLRDLPVLRHEYTIALLSPAAVTPSRNAAWFVEWVMSYRGRDVVRAMREKETWPFRAPRE